MFRNEGVPIDLLEITLIDEGYLRENEDLLEVITDATNLTRSCTYEDASYGEFPDDWTEEDYMAHSSGL